MTDVSSLEARLVEELRGEIRGMREDFRKVSVELGGLTSEVKHLAEASEKTQGYGERIAKLEERAFAFDARLQSSDTERRWIIGLLIGSVLSIVALLIGVFGKH